MKNKLEKIKKNTPLDPKKKFIFSVILVLIPVFILFLIEFSLRIANYGDNYSLFVDFSMYGKEYRTCNRDIGKKYFHNLPYTTPCNDIFLKQKPKNGFRVFVIGSSTTVGFPYSQGVMFSRILQSRLQDSYPGKYIEVINTGMTAINSYTFQDKFGEILKEKPDAVIIYGGQNEFYGGMGIGSNDASGKFRWMKILQLDLLEFKTYQLIRNIIAGSKKQLKNKNKIENAGSATLMQLCSANTDIEYNSEVYLLAHEHFKKNMESILKKANKKGVPVFFSELVCNVKDLPPFGSSKSTNYPSAISVYEEARTFEKEGDYEKAKASYYRAKDLDCIRFRASEDLNKIVDDLAAKYGAYLVPMESIFEKNSPHGLIGNNLITEHVHPNIDGYFIMADAFYSSIVQSKIIGRVDSSNYKPSSYYRKNWGFTELDSVSAELLLHKLKNGWPFKSAAIENRFIKDFKPKGIIDSLAFQAMRFDVFTLESAHKFLAHYYLNNKQPDKAFQEYYSIIKIQPYNIQNYIEAGDLLFQNGSYEKALEIFLSSLKIDREIYILSKTGEIYCLNKNFKEAIPYLEEVNNLDPNFRKQTIVNLLFQAYNETGNSKKAKEIFSSNKELLSQSSAIKKQEVVLRIPSDVKQQIEQAIKDLQSGNIEKALSLLLDANKTHETSLASRFLGDIYLQRKDKKALFYLKKVYPDYSADPQYLNSICYASILFKDFKTAKEILPRLKQLSPNNPNIPVFEKNIPPEYK